MLKLYALIFCLLSTQLLATESIKNYEIIDQYCGLVQSQKLTENYANQQICSLHLALNNYLSSQVESFEIDNYKNFDKEKRRDIAHKVFAHLLFNPEFKPDMKIITLVNFHLSQIQERAKFSTQGLLVMEKILLGIAPWEQAGVYKKNSLTSFKPYALLPTDLQPINLSKLLTRPASEKFYLGINYAAYTEVLFIHKNLIDSRQPASSLIEKLHELLLSKIIKQN